MIKEIFENYEAFYNCVLATAMMNNSLTPEYTKDCSKIVGFIAKAYGLSEALATRSEEYIFGALANIGKVADYKALYKSRDLNGGSGDVDILYEIKAEVLELLDKIGERFALNAFDYSHYKTYQPNIRYYKLNEASAHGIVIAARQIGILNALGIGCKKDYDKAVTRLTQCAYWGDIPSLYLLSYVYKLQGNALKAQSVAEVAALASEYLFAGFTVVPDNVRERYGEDVLHEYAFISSIKQDIINAYNKSEIDYSFVEVIMLPGLDYCAKMQYINNYDKKDWKNVTNSSYKELARKLGFN